MKKYHFIQETHTNNYELLSNSLTHTYKFNQIQLILSETIFPIKVNPKMFVRKELYNVDDQNIYEHENYENSEEFTIVNNNGECYQDNPIFKN